MSLTSTITWVVICMFVGACCWSIGYSFGIEDRFGVAEREERARAKRTRKV